MAKSDKPKSAKKRVKVKNLPTTEKKMPKKKMKQVEGGSKYLQALNEAARKVIKNLE